MDLKATLITVLALLPLGGSCNADASTLSPKDSGNIAQTGPASDTTQGASKTSRFRAADGSLCSSLTRSEHAGEERLHGVTELETGARLVEDVTLDESGALRSAEAVLTGAGGSTLQRVRFDRERGTVEVNAPSLHVEWAVPRDLPWVWTPLLSVASTGAAITTPLDVRVMWRAAANGRTVRLLDLGVLRSYSLTSDQVFSPSAFGGTVVLGDDTSEIENGMPTSLDLKALHARLVRVAPEASDALLAVAGCSPARASFSQ
jgi:hypothetical protein